MKTKYCKSGYAFSRGDGGVRIRHKSSVIEFTESEFQQFICDLTFWIEEAYYGEVLPFVSEEARQGNLEAVKSAPNT